jgi:hypothetical protein
MALTRILAGFGTVLALTTTYAGCSSDSADTPAPGPGGSSAGAAGSSQGSAGSAGSGSSGSAGTTGIDVGGDPPNPDAFWANDPPPPVCSGGTSPPAPGGTPECPDDKNREGCPCPEVGQTKACWPGLRVNRAHGQCKDGVTTCKATGEVGSKWGPCEGYVLPTAGETSGPAACVCFTSGFWDIKNLEPCFLSDKSKQVVQATSKCPTGNFTLPAPVPSEPWSTSTLKVDCAGKYSLCYTIRAGDSANRQPSDCVIHKACIDVDYPVANVEQDLPVLPAWATTTPEENACAAKFAEVGGYGEMSVVGESVVCDQIPNKIFNVIKYCSLACNKDKTLPGCDKCSAGQGGGF